MVVAYGIDANQIAIQEFDELISRRKAAYEAALVRRANANQGTLFEFSEEQS